MIHLKMTVEGDIVYTENIDGCVKHVVDEDTPLYTVLVRHNRETKKKKANRWMLYRPTESLISRN